MLQKLHRLSAQYIKDAVYAANDGIVTTFAVVASVAGANLSATIVLILGVANLIADGFSMASGNYLGTKSEGDHYEHERAKEEEILNSSPKDAEAEVKAIVKEKGYSDGDVGAMTELVLKKKDFFLDFLLFEKLGLGPVEKGEAVKASIVTFVSFLAAGAVPLIPYIIFANGAGSAFLWASIFTGATLFAVGAARTLFSDKNWFFGGLEMFFAGGAAAVIAYVIGALLRGIANGVGV